MASTVWHIEAKFASWWTNRPGQTRREAGTQSQGSSSEDSPVAGVPHNNSTLEVNTVKANLARFTMALSILATMALTLGAGVKWDWWD